jgi:hypothetical protein
VLAFNHFRKEVHVLENRPEELHSRSA